MKAVAMVVLLLSPRDLLVQARSQASLVCESWASGTWGVTSSQSGTYYLGACQNSNWTSDTCTFTSYTPFSSFSDWTSFSYVKITRLSCPPNATAQLCTCAYSNGACTAHQSCSKGYEGLVTVIKDYASRRVDETEEEGSDVVSGGVRQLLEGGAAATPDVCAFEEGCCDTTPEGWTLIDVRCGPKCTTPCPK